MHPVTEKPEEAELESPQARRMLEERVAARTADLATANKALETFAYSISHDLRAPVRLVSAFSELLARESSRLSPAGQQHLQSIRHEVARMNEMIDGLLDLSRLSRARLSEGPVDLTSLAEDIAQGLRLTTPARRVEFVIQPGLRSQGDERLLRVVLLNLLGNAWKFTRDHPAPRIEFGAIEQEGWQVFFVRDNGAGFDMAGAGRLFTPFQRLHTTDEFEGVGVGLATVRRILERHGGQVWAEGEVGKGATFYFTVPVPETEKGTGRIKS